MRVVDGRVSDVAGVLAGVDEAEVVGTWLALLEVSCEDVLVEDTLVDGGIEEGGLGCRCDSVDGAESKTEETVVVGVLLELSADRLGGLDCLLGDGHTSDSDGVGVDVTTGAGPIAVRDAPGSTREQLGSARLGRVVDRVTGLLRRSKLRGEDPSDDVSDGPDILGCFLQISRPSVEVQVQSLATNRYRAQILRVVLLRRSSHRALSTSGCGNILRDSSPELCDGLSKLDWTGLERLLHTLVDSETDVGCWCLGNGLGHGKRREGRSGNDGFVGRHVGRSV